MYLALIMVTTNIIWWCRDCRKIVDQIHNFLKLDVMTSGSPVFDLPQNVAPSSAGEGADSSPVADDASSATSSDESFERVSTADLAEYDAVATEAKPSAADALPDPADEERDTLDPAADENQMSSSPTDPVPDQADEECDPSTPATGDNNAGSLCDLPSQ